MNISHRRFRIPKEFVHDDDRRGMLLNCDIAIHKGARIFLKLVVFDSQKSLRRFWMKWAGSDPGSGVPGVVNSLGFEVTRVDPSGNKADRKTLKVDPRYFAMMALVDGWLSCEVVCHESVHAAFCYTSRNKSKSLFWNAMENPEEHLAYPAGRIASEVNLALIRATLHNGDRGVRKQRAFNNRRGK